MKDQIAMVFAGVIDEAMSITQVEEAATASTSSSTRGSKRRRRYVKHDVKWLILGYIVTILTTIVCT
jgi:hypothetical protein